MRAARDVERGGEFAEGGEGGAVALRGGEGILGGEKDVVMVEVDVGS